MQFIVGSNYYLRQRYRPSVIYLYRYFTYIDILFHKSNRQWAWCSGYRVSLSRWRLRFDSLLGNSLNFAFCNVTRVHSVAPLILLLLHCVHKKHLSRLMTKPTQWHVRPAKTQISLGIRPIWSESSLSAWRKLGSLATYWAHSEDSDQIGRMHRLIWAFAGRTRHYVGFVVWWLIWNIWW